MLANMLSIKSYVFVLPLMILLTGCFGITVNSGSSGTVKITELVMAKDVTSDGNPIEPALEFNTNDKRIYCIVGVTGPENVRIGSRWYFGDKLIYDRMLSLGTQRRGTFWLDMAPGQKFPVGDYRVEIYLIKEPIKTITFKVVE